MRDRKNYAFEIHKKFARIEFDRLDRMLIAGVAHFCMIIDPLLYTLHAQLLKIKVTDM